MEIIKNYFPEFSIEATVGRVPQRVFPKRIVRTRIGVCGRIEKFELINLLGSIWTIAHWTLVY